MGVAEDYRGRVERGELRGDAAQSALALRLDALADALAVYRPQAAGGLRRFFAKSAGTTPRGLFIHGDVGRGKTMLMDMFHEAAAIAPKRRIHFHAFMQDVHRRLHAARRASADAIAPVARALAAEARLLCLDEMQIADIADAMIVGRLFEALIGAGTVIVTTSNLAPAELYRDGLNRALFLPFIGLIESRLDVVCLGGSADYRLGRVKAHESFIWPLGADADAALQDMWERLTDWAAGEPRDVALLGRTLHVPQAARGCARFTFAELCEAPLGAPDYLALAESFGTVFVERIPRLSAADANAARRFILLIDALYDAKRRLVASADGPPEALAPSGKHQPEFARTASRLREMQSAAWWGKKIAET